MRYADAALVARAGGDGLHLSLDSHAPLADLVASVIWRAMARRSSPTGTPEPFPPGARQGRLTNSTDLRVGPAATTWEGT